MAVRKPRPARNLSDAHLRIDQNSPTWREVDTYCRNVIARASALIDDPGTPVVDSRVALGDKRTALGLLRLANPEEKVADRDVPEYYPTGGPEH